MNSSNSINPSDSSNPSKSTKSILITVDVEDWFQVENLRSLYPLETWDFQELRIERSTRLLLDVFDVNHVQATFFILGWIAERKPDIINEIKARGHEIASHGYGHQLCYEHSTESLREDLYRSKALLEDIIGDRVFGYRAPSFSITKDLIVHLGELGYEYDSSYNNFVMNKRYGNANGLFISSTNGRLVADNGIIELPLTNLECVGNILPWAGGGYFRFLPSALFFYGVSKILDHRNAYIFYCHPWEIDATQPRMDSLPFLSRYRHYLNLHKTLGRLKRFFSKFQGYRFISCKNYLHN